MRREIHLVTLATYIKMAITWNKSQPCVRIWIFMWLNNCLTLCPFLIYAYTYNHVCNKSDRTGATSGAGIVYPSQQPEFTPGFQMGSWFSIFSFLCSVLSLFVLLTIALSVLLRFTDIFKLFTLFKMVVDIVAHKTFSPIYI